MHKARHNTALVIIIHYRLPCAVLCLTFLNCSLLFAAEANFGTLFANVILRTSSPESRLFPLNVRLNISTFRRQFAHFYTVHSSMCNVQSGPCVNRADNWKNLLLSYSSVCKNNSKQCPEIMCANGLVMCSPLSLCLLKYNTSIVCTRPYHSSKSRIFFSFFFLIASVWP